MSTAECRKDCDVFEDWQKMEADNADLVITVTKLQAQVEVLEIEKDVLKERIELAEVKK